MDSSLIEKSAINYLIDELIVTKKLSPYISENDKEPSWDGNIYIYGEENFSKENLLGRVPVQVKGKQEKSKNLKKEKISYPVETVDLKNYLNDGGVIFFVILIDEENLKKRKIYYADLTPVRLKIELEKSKNQITKSIKFKEFSSDNQRKVCILLNCLENLKKQASFSDIPLLTIDELNKNNIERIEIPFVSTKEEIPQKALLNSDIYLYARLKNSPIFQPVKVLIDELETHEKQKADISIDSKKYYSSIEIIRKKDSTEFIIGESFSVTITENKKIAQLNYKNSDKIRILANDLEFMIHQIEKGYFWLCHNKQLINSHFYRGVSELPYKLLFAVIYTHLEFRYEMSHTITSHHVHHFHQTRIPDGTLLDYMVQYRKPLFPQFFLYPKKFLPENNPHHKEFHLRPYIQNNANQ